MANYSKLDGYVFDKQSNEGWGITLKMSGKAPAVAKRIFDTYEHALSYVNDVNDTAIEGLVLSVVADTDDALNGVYFVQQAASAAVEGDENINGVLVKLGSEDYTDTEIKNKTKTYSIAKVEGDEFSALDENIKEAYKLVDGDGVKEGEYILVYKDSALQEVKLVGQELQFTYLLTDGNTSTVGVDVSNFLAESEFKNGLSVNENGEVSVKVDAASEAFLTVGADGVKLAGVQDAIDAEKTRAEGAEAANADAIAKLNGDAKTEGSVAKAVADAKAAETSARTQAIANTKTELEDKINNKSQIVDVTNLFASGGTLNGYTMKELANSHLVYKDESNTSVNGTPYVQVSMVGGSPSNSAMVTYGNDVNINLGMFYTLIAEIYSEQNGKYILTQYLARVGLADGTSSDKWKTSNVEQHILATQESIDTLSTEVNAALDEKQGIISDLANIRSGAIKGASAVQSINVTQLFTQGNSLTPYTLLDLTKNKLYHDNGNTVKCVGYGNSAISPNTNEASLVMESFEGAVRNISIAHIKLNGSTLTTDSVKTYSSNVFVMRVSQVDYDTMKAAGTLDENTLYVIAEITE